MKRKLFFTSLLALFFGVALFLSSCEDPPPYCEVNNVGDITIVNQTGFWFYFALDDYSDFRLNDGASKTYYDEPAGTHYFYIYDDFTSTWYYETEHLSSCEDLTFTWYLNKKKSSARSFVLEIARNGEVIKTLTEFKPAKNK